MKEDRSYRTHLPVGSLRSVDKPKTIKKDEKMCGETLKSEVAFQEEDAHETHQPH